MRRLVCTKCGADLHYWVQPPVLGPGGTMYCHACWVGQYPPTATRCDATHSQSLGDSCVPTLVGDDEGGRVLVGLDSEAGELIVGGRRIPLEGDITHSQSLGDEVDHDS